MEKGDECENLSDVVIVGVVAVNALDDMEITSTSIKAKLTILFFICMTLFSFAFYILT